MAVFFFVMQPILGDMKWIVNDAEKTRPFYKDEIALATCTQWC